MSSEGGYDRSWRDAVTHTLSPMAKPMICEKCGGSSWRMVQGFTDGTERGPLLCEEHWVEQLPKRKRKGAAWEDYVARRDAA